MRLHRYTIAVSCFLLSVANIARADEVLIEEAGLSMTLPAAWVAKYEKTGIPTGQLMQRWARDSVAVGEFTASPGLVCAKDKQQNAAARRMLSAGQCCPKIHGHS